MGPIETKLQKGHLLKIDSTIYIFFKRIAMSQLFCIQEQYTLEHVN